MPRLTLPQSRALSVIDGHLAPQSTIDQAVETIQQTERTTWQDQHEETELTVVNQNKNGIVTRSIIYHIH